MAFWQLRASPLTPSSSKFLPAFGWMSGTIGFWITPPRGWFIPAAVFKIPQPECETDGWCILWQLGPRTFTKLYEICRAPGRNGHSDSSGKLRHRTQWHLHHQQQNVAGSGHQPELLLRRPVSKLPRVVNVGLVELSILGQVQGGPRRGPG